MQYANNNVPDRNYFHIGLMENNHAKLFIQLPYYMAENASSQCKISSYLNKYEEILMPPSNFC